MGIFARSETPSSTGHRHSLPLALLACLTFFVAGPALAQADIVRPLPSQQMSADTVSLDRAIALAAHYNHQVNISRDEIPKSEKLIAAARTQGMPQLRLLALPGQEVASPLRGNYAVLGLAAQPLTQLYRVGLSERLAKLERRRSENVSGDFYVDDTCIDCDACRTECPVEAIFPEHEVPERWRHYVALNAEMAKSSSPIVERKEPLRAR